MILASSKFQAFRHGCFLILFAGRSSGSVNGSWLYAFSLIICSVSSSSWLELSSSAVADSRSSESLRWLSSRLSLTSLFSSPSAPWLPSSSPSAGSLFFFFLRLDLFSSSSSSSPFESLSAPVPDASSSSFLFFFGSSSYDWLSSAGPVRSSSYAWLSAPAAFASIDCVCDSSSSSSASTIGTIFYFCVIGSSGQNMSAK